MRMAMIAMTTNSSIRVKANVADGSWASSGRDVTWPG